MESPKCILKFKRFIHTTKYYNLVTSHFPSNVYLKIICWAGLDHYIYIRYTEYIWLIYKPLRKTLR